MTEIILHHFAGSPYAHKARVAMGIKSLAWRSVEIPNVMPKPDLTALTGGYRNTPVMQIGPTSTATRNASCASSTGDPTTTGGRPCARNIDALTDATRATL